MSDFAPAGSVSHLSQFLFLRPTLGLLIAVFCVLGGALALSSMVKESTPDLDVPIAIVETRWSGADPQSIDQSVTPVIEKELKTLAGVKKLRSVSFSSFSMVTVEFDATIDTAAAMAEFIFGGLSCLGRGLAEDGEIGPNGSGLQLTNVHMVEYVGGASGSLGHSYFRTNPAVASDLVLTVRYDRDPGASNARPLAHRGGVFWQVDDSYLGPVDHSNSGAREWSTRPGTAVIQA